MLSGPGPEEISFQEFKTKLLGQGQVAKLEVTNGNTVRVYVKPRHTVKDSTLSGVATSDGAVDLAAEEHHSFQTQGRLPSSPHCTLQFGGCRHSLVTDTARRWAFMMDASDMLPLTSTRSDRLTLVSVGVWLSCRSMSCPYCYYV